MAEFVRYTLEDGTEVIFESCDEKVDSGLVSSRGGADPPTVAAGGRLGDRLTQVAGAAEEISRGLRERLGPHETELTFGVKVSGRMNWWFIANAGGEASMMVTLRWKAAPDLGATGSLSRGAGPEEGS